MFRFICVVFVCSLTWQDAKVDVRERPESFFEVPRIAKGHRIASAHLSKWYRVKATEKSGWLRVHVKGLADDPLAPLVRAYTVQADDLLKKIKSNGDSVKQAKRAFKSHDAMLRIPLDHESNGEYFIEVSGLGVSAGNYNLYIDYCFREDDYPDMIGHAETIALHPSMPTIITGEIDAKSSVDCLNFHIPETGELLVQVWPIGGKLDTHLALFDGRERIAQHHNEIKWPVEAGKHYWVQVRAGNEKLPVEIQPGLEATG